MQGEMEIALFPLPNLVLFPHIVVPLHIFEERYKLMINGCVDRDELFGLVLLHSGAVEEKQKLLEMDVTAERLRMLIAHLTDTIRKLEQQRANKEIMKKLRGNGDLGMPHAKDS